jgi:hypothetical protein
MITRGSLNARNPGGVLIPARAERLAERPGYLEVQAAGSRITARETGAMGKTVDFGILDPYAYG